MLHTNMNPLPQDLVPNLFVDFNTDGTFGDVPDTTGASMVEFVRHTFVNGAVNSDVNIVADMVCPEVGCKSYCPLLAEGTGEGVSGSGP